jgi:hypothetical protein
MWGNVVMEQEKTMQSFLGVLVVVMMMPLNVQARVFELRGVGALPLETEIGVPGEGITVTAVLDSNNFYYVEVPNPIFHLFETIETIPMEIVGTSTGTFADVSSINRFVALEWEQDFGGDFLSLDVSVGTSSTSLFSLMTQGQSGFNGNETPFTPDQLFDLFEDAMQNETLWQTAAGAVFLGAPENIMSFGTLSWSLTDVTTALPGDFDIDGDIDGRDFLTWQRDTSVGALDDWQTYYGVGALVGTNIAVPEPTASALAALLALMAVVRRDNRHCESELYRHAELYFL